jgi:hypothetical protein
MRIMRRALLPVLAIALSACIIPPSSQQRLAESAFDLANASRFGRMDIALEHVKDTAQSEFTQRHAQWGRQVRIVDSEFGSVSLRKDGDADVTVTVAWQRLDESIMRSTELGQRWTEKRGTWWLVKEEERAGDRGLLAEVVKPEDKAKAAAAQAPSAPPPPGHSRPPRDQGDEGARGMGPLAAPS